MKADININAVFNIDLPAVDSLQDPTSSDTPNDEETEEMKKSLEDACVDIRQEIALDTAVKMLVARWLGERRSFSAYTITSVLRDRVLYLPKETLSSQTVDVNNHRGDLVSVDFVDHQKVREIVRRMYDEGQMQDFIGAQQRSGDGSVYVLYSPPEFLESGS